MAETKKTEVAAAAAPPEAACLTLRQKLVEMRKACPEIVKKQHSDGVSYKYAKIYDVWEKITPIPRRQHRAPDLLRGFFRDCILQLRR